MSNPCLSTREDAGAINSFGLAVFAKERSADSNMAISPLSLHAALSMAFLGADGKTEQELAVVLGTSRAEVAAEYPLLLKRVPEIQATSQDDSKRAAKHGGKRDSIKLSIANNIFPERSFPLRADFLNQTRSVFDAALTPLDFRNQAERSRGVINSWVASATEKKILELIPQNQISSATSAVLVNALYLQAPWEEQFEESSTQAVKFVSPDGKESLVPMMRQQRSFGYETDAEFESVTIPYATGELQFVVLLPTKGISLASFSGEAVRTHLARAKALHRREINLFLPKFKIPGQTIDMAGVISALGAPSAFDEPERSADFSRMAETAPPDYLKISKVFHQVYFDLNEQGTEAAAATAVVMMVEGALMRKPEVIPDVRIDHPFIFAVQDTKTGALLFLGQVMRL